MAANDEAMSNPSAAQIAKVTEAISARRLDVAPSEGNIRSL